MGALRIERVLSLPTPPVGNTIYIVKRTEAGLADVYFTNTDGSETRHLLSKEDIESMMLGSMQTNSNIVMVANIVARNAITAAYNALVYVQDATADPAVKSGGALYFYQYLTKAFTKMCEFESMDVILSWSNVLNKPTSTVAAIDDAVAKAHSHTNKAVLDKLTEDVSGALAYSGKKLQFELNIVQEW